jgi:acetolactate decarboxylase
MKKIKIFVTAAFGLLFLVSCKEKGSAGEQVAFIAPQVQVVGAMRDAMWKGEIFSKIDLDTISNKDNLYALGPVEQMTGEILVYDGKSYVSKVITDSTMQVTETYEAGAPFLVYSNVSDWKRVEVPENVSSLKDFETFITVQAQALDAPFTFKLQGSVKSALIHVQNLPPGTKVSSPQEAHVGQKKYSLDNREVDLLGFYSTNHKGIFTHHDTNMHIHLITKDLKMMGHLDEVEFDKVTLFLPEISVE